MTFNPIKLDDMNKEPKNHLPVFQIVLLFAKEPVIPFEQDRMRILGRYFGRIEKTKDHEAMFGYYLLDQIKRDEEKDADQELSDEDVEKAPFLAVTKVADFYPASISSLERSQMWDIYEERDGLIASLGHQVTGLMMNFDQVPLQSKVDAAMDYMEALLEIYPEASAVYFPTAGKLIKAEDILAKKAKREDRFISYAMNIRLFALNNVDMLVDTLGLHALGLPDVQYHYHNLDTVTVVRHAYMVAKYILDYDNPVKEGDYINAIAGLDITEDKTWDMHFEEAMAQPKRQVVDVNTMEFASGGRHYDNENDQK